MGEESTAGIGVPFVVGETLGRRVRLVKSCACATSVAAHRVPMRKKPGAGGAQGFSRNRQESRSADLLAAGLRLGRATGGTAASVASTSRSLGAGLGRPSRLRLGGRLRLDASRLRLGAGHAASLGTARGTTTSRGRVDRRLAADATIDPAANGALGHPALATEGAERDPRLLGSFPGGEDLLLLRSGERATLRSTNGSFPLRGTSVGCQRNRPFSSVGYRRVG